MTINWAVLDIAWQVCGGITVVILLLGLILNFKIFTKKTHLQFKENPASTITSYIMGGIVILVILLVAYILGPVGLVLLITFLRNNGII